MTALAAEAEQVPPAFVYRPPRTRTMAGQLGQLAEKLGRPLFAEQVTALDVLTGLLADGRAATRMAAIICGRQNMKTWDMQLIALGRLLMPGGDRYAVWSAHEVATSQETFRDFLELIEAEDHGWLRKRILRTSQANGKEAIEFVGGRRLRFRARRRTGGRGLTGDALYLDEAFALVPAHMGAMLPILSTRRRAAVFVGSSAGLAESEVLRGIRDRGRSGRPGSPAYIEWCAPGSLKEPGCERADCDHVLDTPGCCLDRDEFRILANPAIRAGRIGAEALASERQEMTPAEFARERLGWWDSPAGPDVRPINTERWKSMADAGSRRAPDSQVGMGIDVARDRSSAAIGWCGRRADGLLHWEVVRHARGTSWVPAAVAELAGKMPLALVRPKKDDVRPAIAGDVLALKPLLPALRELGIDPLLMTGSDIAAACSGVVGDVDERRARHLGQDQLDRAAAAAVARNVGDGGMAFGKRVSDDADITPLYGVTTARWVFLQALRPYDLTGSFG
jgi:hypothetical protein